jgi:chromosomal replication initiator protein
VDIFLSPMDTQHLWQSVLSELQLQVSKAVYQTFLSQTNLISFEGTSAVIGCQKPMMVTMIEKRYSGLIKQVLDKQTGQNITLSFTANTNRKEKTMDGPLFSSNRMPEPAIVLKPSALLNPDYTFDNFAVSSTNQMAYAAATAVADAPGSSYNPLFLYGGVGVGKTHLMQAIGHKAFQTKQKTKIVSCTGEEFTNEIIEAIGNKTTSPFKKKFRNADILLIDDVQFIAGKNAVQEEFFHTFNAIVQGNGQIVMTSDRPPEEINKLEARLRSRFEGGLIIDIGQPDFELRTAILLIKAKKRNIDLSIEAAKLIAENVDNPRKLDGMLVRVMTESFARNIPVDVDFVSGILGKTVKEAQAQKKISPTEVMNTVASFYNLKLSQLKGDKRDNFLSLPRQILYYILRVELNLPLMDIGDMLGGRDHSTILYGVRKISKMLSTDDKIRGDIMGIKSQLFG